MNKLYLLLFLFTPIIMYGQKYDYTWKFVSFINTSSNPYGHQNLAVTFDFNHNPVLIYADSAQYSTTYCELVSVSDSAGNFMFYSNGHEVVDSTYQLMPNGGGINQGYVSSITPYSYYGHPAPEGMITIPHPDSSFLFDIFHIKIDSHPEPYFKPYELFLTQVDMRLNNGLGDVTIKNRVLIHDTLCLGQLEAVKHANGRDWWVLIPEGGASNGYYTLLVKADTIEGPFYQQVGRVMSYQDWLGQACFSPDGTKYARSRDDFDIFDFDRCTGELCNHRHWEILEWNDSTNYGAASLAFSPSGRFVYFGTAWTLYQLDLQAPTLATGIDTIWEGSLFDNGFYNGQLAPNGKIYFSGGSSYWSVINAPDSLGAACNFQYEGITLPVYSPTTIPNFPHYRTPPLASCPPCEEDTTGVDRVVGREDVFNIYPNPAINLINLQLSGEGNTAILIKIVNSIGQTITAPINNMGNNLLSINSSEWPSGIYYISVFKNGILIGSKPISILR